MKPEIGVSPEEGSEILPVSDDENQMFPATPSDGDVFSATPNSATSDENAEEVAPPPTKKRRYIRGSSTSLTFLDLPALCLLISTSFQQSVPFFAVGSAESRSLYANTPRYANMPTNVYMPLGRVCSKECAKVLLGTRCMSTELHAPSIHRWESPFEWHSEANGNTS